jgi:hypothetical protein
MLPYADNVAKIGYILLQRGESMKFETIMSKWYIVIFICLQAWWLNILHIFDNNFTIHMILTSMLDIGIGGSMVYVLFHGIEEQRKREAMISKEVADKL